VKTVDHGQFAVIYGTYYHQVYRFFLRHGVQPAVAEDLVQDTFLRFYHVMDTFRGRSALWTFLRVIAHRTLIDSVRDQTAVKRAGITIALDDIFAEEIPGADGDHLGELLQREQADQLRRAVVDLPSGMRSVVELFLQGFSYEEIAREAKLSMNAVKSRLRDARVRLRDTLASDGLNSDTLQDGKKKRRGQ
jgi:RNA polymerase sigma-70 factor (ECF subfamily)